MDIYSNRLHFNMKNKEILTEISRIKELFNYGALLNEQTNYEKYNKQPYTTSSNRYKNLVNAFKKAFPNKEFFVTDGQNKLKYKNSQGINIVLRTNDDDNVVDGIWGVMEDGKDVETLKGRYEFKNGKLEFI
jgi:hypothetical protein